MFNRLTDFLHKALDKVDQLIGTPNTSPPTADPFAIPPQPSFFGRDRELEIIAEAIAPEARTWGALIAGPNGIGKTAFAICAAHLAPAEHFTHKIFLTTQAQPAGFMRPSYMALLTELARALKAEGIGRLLESERAQAVLGVLSDKRALLVVDNLETLPEAECQQLFQFLSRLPAGCKAIVTSRRRAEVAVPTVTLDCLEEPEALDLLDELAKSSRYLWVVPSAERRPLYEITKGHPLRMYWAVGQLGRPGSQCATLADVRQYLSYVPQDSDPLAYLFNDLLATFSAGELALLAVLMHYPMPVSLERVAEMAELPTEQVQPLAEGLADRALLVGNPAPQTFALLPLAAQFLWAKRPEVLPQTAERLTNYADILVQEEGADEVAGFPVLAAEWPTLAAALPLLLAGDNERLQSVCGGLDSFLDFSGRWDELLALHEQAEEKARAAKDFANAGWRAYHAGCVYYQRGQATSVFACADRAAAHWQRANVGAHEKAIAIRLRGNGYELNKDYPAAIAAYRQALALWRALNAESDSDSAAETDSEPDDYSTDIALILNDLAEAEQAAGDYAAAERDYTEALEISKEIDAEEAVANYTGNLADLALDRKDWATAERLAREALALLEEANRDALGIAFNCLSLAQALAAQDQPQAGLPYARRAVETYTKLHTDAETLAEAQAILRECEGG